jgi:hypothetical protein
VLQLLLLLPGVLEPVLALLLLPLPLEVVALPFLGLLLLDAAAPHTTAA